jgi:hypothetical protein
MVAALDKKLDGDPKLWRIVDGKLYVDVAAPAQKRWLEDARPGWHRPPGSPRLARTAADR